MRRYINSIRCLSKSIVITFIVSIVLVIIYEMIEQSTTKDCIFLFLIAKLIGLTCYSIISSIIFYFIVVHLPIERRIANHILILKNKTFILVDIGKVLHKLILEANHISVVDDKLCRAKITSLLQSMNPYDKVYSKEYLVSHENWFHYLESIEIEVKDVCTQLFLFNDILKEEYLETISMLSDSVILFSKEGMGNQDFLKDRSNDIIRFLELSEKVGIVFRNEYIYYIKN